MSNRVKLFANVRLTPEYQHRSSNGSKVEKNRKIYKNK